MADDDDDDDEDDDGIMMMGGLVGRVMLLPGVQRKQEPNLGHGESTDRHPPLGSNR